MGRELGKQMPLIMMVAGGVAGYYGGPGGRAAWGRAMMGAGVGGTMGQTMGPMMGYDPEEERRAEIRETEAENMASIRQWRTEQATRFQDWQENVQPVREEFLSQYGQILSGETDIASSPMFAGMFGNIRAAEGRARERIMESLPTGGARERALRDVGQSYGDMRAKTNADIMKWIYGQAQTMGVPYQSQAPPMMPSALQQPQVSADYGALATLGMMYGAGQGGRERPPQQTEFDMGMQTGLR